MKVASLDRFILILKRKEGKRIDEWYVLVLAREVCLRLRGVVETPVRLVCLSLQMGNLYFPIPSNNCQICIMTYNNNNNNNK